jgi:hypothetical protein
MLPATQADQPFVCPGPVLPLSASIDDHRYVLMGGCSGIAHVVTHHPVDRLCLPHRQQQSVSANQASGIKKKAQQKRRDPCSYPGWLAYNMLRRNGQDETEWVAQAQVRMTHVLLAKLSCVICQFLQ